MKEQYWITIVVIVLVGVLLWFGARAKWQNMSESDKIVFGAWRGTMEDKAGNNIEVAYLFWSGGNYTIRPASPFPTLYERGVYKTSLVERDIVSLQLTPDKVDPSAGIFSGLGEPRTLEIRRENINGIDWLIFPDGSRYSESSLEPYRPQT